MVNGSAEANLRKGARSLGSILARKPATAKAPHISAHFQVHRSRPSVCALDLQTCPAQVERRGIQDEAAIANFQIQGSGKGRNRATYRFEFTPMRVLRQGPEGIEIPKGNIPVVHLHLAGEVIRQFLTPQAARPEVSLEPQRAP